MALATYSDLVAAISVWSHRSSDAGFIANIPLVITLAESRMQMDLQVRQLEQSVLRGTAATVQAIVAPSDLNQVRAVTLLNSVNNSRDLQFMTAGRLQETWGTVQTGEPVNYSLVGSNILLGPIPDSVYSITLDYFSNIAGLTPTNATNAVLTAYPDLYLHACLLFAAQYSVNVDMTVALEALYQADVTRINANNWAQMGTMTMEVGRWA